MENIIKTGIRWCLYGLALAIILFAVLVILLRYSTPLLNSKKEFFVKWGEQILQVPVSVQSLQARWRGFSPEITLVNIQVGGRKSEQINLRIQKLSVSIDIWHSLLKLKLLPNEVDIDGAKIAIYQNKAQKSSFNQEAQIDLVTWQEIERISYWLLSQADVYVRGLDIYWVSQAGDILPLHQVSLQIVNGPFQYSISGHFQIKNTKPARHPERSRGISLNRLGACGGRSLGCARDDGDLHFQSHPTKPTEVKFMAKNISAPLSLANLKAEAYVQVKNADVKQWLRFIPHSVEAVQVKKGLLDGEWWVYWEGGIIKRIQSRLSIYELDLDYLKKQHLNFKDFQGNFAFQSEKGGWKFSADRLTGSINDYPFNVSAKPYRAYPGFSGLNGHLSLDRNEAYAKFEGVNLAFSKNWPSLENLEGELLWKDQKISLSHVKASLLDNPVEISEARIDDLSKPVLIIQGSSKTDFSKALPVIFHSPLSVKQDFSMFSMQGPLQLNLALKIPFSSAKTVVQGRVQFQQATLLLGAPWLNITQLKGEFSFNNTAISSKVIQGIFLEEPISLLLSSPSKKDERSLSVRVQSPLANGELKIPFESHRALWINFENLSWPETKGSLNNTLDPSAIPSINARIQRLQYGKKSLGSLQFISTRYHEGMTINKLKLHSAGADLVVDGFWHKFGEQQSSLFQGYLSTSDLGQLLNQWNYPRMLSKGAGTIQFRLNWPASPFHFLPEILNGSLKINLKKGSVLKISEDAQSHLSLSRLINILSIPNLSKLLILDIHGMKGDGFPFSEMKGDFVFSNGSAQTDNFYMDGSVAQVWLQGKVGFADQRYDLTLHVAPYVTASLPVIAGVAGGPVVGGVAWVAEKLVGSTIGKVIGKAYKVTGTWQEPIITKIEKTQE